MVVVDATGDHWQDSRRDVKRHHAGARREFVTACFFRRLLEKRSYLSEAITDVIANLFVVEVVDVPPDDARCLGTVDRPKLDVVLVGDLEDVALELAILTDPRADELGVLRELGASLLLELPNRPFKSVLALVEPASGVLEARVGSHYIARW